MKPTNIHPFSIRLSSEEIDTLDRVPRSGELSISGAIHRVLADYERVAKASKAMDTWHQDKGSLCPLCGRGADLEVLARGQERLAEALSRVSEQVGDLRELLSQGY